MKQHQKRIGFKVSVKDKWVYSYWYPCDGYVPMNYSLKELMENLMKIHSEILLIKIERREQ